MAQIHHGMLKPNEILLFNIEEKLCRYLLHKELLLVYKRCNNFPKGFNLKFNLTLGSNNHMLQDNCNRILNKASCNIRNHVFTTLEKQIKELKYQRYEMRKKLFYSLSRDNYAAMINRISNQITILERDIKLRHQRKFARDNIEIVEQKRKNRRFSKKQLLAKIKQKRRSSRKKYKQKIQSIKDNAPDQNAINLSSLELSDVQKSLLLKGPSFVPTPADINWYNVRKDFDKFVNQLRYKAFQSQQTTSTNNLADEIDNTSSNTKTFEPPKKIVKHAPLFRSKETKHKSLELFISSLEKDLFEPQNIRNPRNNMTTNEMKALKEIKSWKENVVRVQDKGSRFVVLSNQQYEDKIQFQIDRSSFKELQNDPSMNFETKVHSWIKKWSGKNIISDKWKEFITPEQPAAGKMYGLVKTHKDGNPVRVITSGCNTAVENLSIFVEKTLYDIISNIPSRIKDSSHMLDIIDELNLNNLPTDSILFSFDVINMFPSIDNKSGLEAVRSILELRKFKDPPTICVTEALELCLECNNSVFNNRNFLQVDGTAQGPHMSCSYSDIAMYKFDCKALEYHLKPTIWKRFRD